MKDFNKDIILCIQKAQSEDQIIQKLQSYMKKNKKIKSFNTTATVWNNTTPLVAAVTAGYLKVVQCLVEELGVNLYETVDCIPFKKDFGCNPTALDMALFLSEKDIALYLIPKTKHFTRDGRDNKICVPLRLAIINNIDDTDKTEIFKAILLVEPELLYEKDLQGNVSLHKDSQGNSLLHIAAGGGKTGAVKIIEYLFKSAQPFVDINALNVLGMSPLYLALVNSHVAAIKTLIANGANALYTYINDRELGLQKITTLELIGIKVGKKIACMNVLLAAGAGLDKSLIPSEFYSICKIIDPNKIDFLLVAKKNGKNTLLTSVKQVQDAIGNSEWQFEFDQIAQTIALPEIQKSPHAQQLSKIFNVQSELFVPDSVNLKNDDYLNHLVNIQKDIPIRELLYLQHEITFCVDILQRKRQELPTSENARLLIKEYGSIFPLLFSYFNHNQWDKYQFSGISATLPKILEDMLCKLQSFILQIEDINNTEDVLEEALSFLIFTLKSNHSLLQQKIFSDLYVTILICTQAIRNLLAKQYLGNNNEILVLYLIRAFNKTNNILSQFTHTKTDEQKRDIVDFAFIEVYLYLNVRWYQKAYDAFQQIIEDIKFSVTNNSGITIDIMKMVTMKGYLETQPDLSEAFHFIQLMNMFKFIDCKTNKSFVDMNELFTKSKEAYILKTLPMYVEKLSDMGEVEQQENIVKVKLQDKNHIENLSQYFKKNNLNLKVEVNHIILTESFILSIDAKKHINTMIERIKILKNTENNNDDSAALNKASRDIVQQLNKLSIDESRANPDISKKEKNKTYKEAKNNTNTEEKQNNKVSQEVNFGFTQRAEHTPAVPIDFNNTIPNDTYFLTMPLNDLQFTPFFKLFLNEDSIRGVATKGLNKQGAKLSSELITDDNYKKKRIPIVRLKILGAEGKGKLRAKGYICEENSSVNGHKRKMFLISEVVDKKREQRKGYK